MTGGSNGGTSEKTPSKSRDDVVRKRDFQRAQGVDIHSFMVKQEPEDTPEITQTPSPEPEDIAVGEITSLFSSGKEERHNPGSVQSDGTVLQEPEMDSVTDLAVHGEKRLGFGLLVAMVLTWSAIGAIVGTVLPEIPSGLGLLAMGLFGLYLGERWIPNPNMRLLGVTWVIISMKLFYGLAIDAWHWGWFDGLSFGANEMFGTTLIGIVSLNIFLAQRHNEDAIAAQATLILLLVGSATGAYYGEIGVAVMIGLGTLLMHGLAIYRQSGNLASLGIASSYLWVGIHALSNDWAFFGLEIVPFEDGLLLFLLMTCVTATNAIIAAKFVRAENWFSKAFEAMGLGKPALWSVSVSLGMIGALLAITAHRLETGYALAQLMLLISAFSGSYLVVRGIDVRKLAPYIIFPAPFLLIGLSLYTSGALGITLPWNLDGYSLYAVFTAMFTVVALLRNQTAVSDHVLWLGGLAIVLLLTLLIPSGDSNNGSRILLITQGVVWIGLSGLAVYRSSPSIAGTAVLGPWVWLLLFATDADARLISADFIPISINEFDLFLWMSLLVVQQIWVNLRHGEVGLNLAARLVGLSEVGARLRDSGLAKLWNLSFLFSVVVTWAIVRPNALPMYGVVIILGSLLIGHSLMVYFERHLGKPQTLMSFWGIFALLLSWTYGQSSFWALSLVISSAILLKSSDRRRAGGATESELERFETLPGQLLTMMMGFLTAFFIMIALDPLTTVPLTGTEHMLDKEMNLLVLMLIGLVALVLYLLRAATLEKLLPPAVTAVALIISMALAGRSIAVEVVVLASIIAFVGSGAYLAVQGEFRSGIRALTKKENRIQRLKDKQERIQTFLESSGMEDSEVLQLGGTQEGEETTSTPTSNLRLIDTELLTLVEKQRKRQRRSGSSGDMDLYVGDIHHQPTIVLLFLSTTILATSYLSFVSGNTLLALSFSVMISILFVGLSRIRANQIGLRLPDIMGIEAPIALGMLGLVLVHVAGRASNSVVELGDATHLLVFFGGLVMLGGIGLLGRNDLGLRIPNALEGVIYLAAIDRVLCVVIGGEVPIPFDIDPFITTLSTLSWTAPLIIIEALLLTAVFGFDWVESKRIQHDMSDHRGAGGRSAWLLFIALLSFGPATFAVIIQSARRGVWWTQPAVVLAAWLMLPMAYLASSAWLSDIISLPSVGFIASCLGFLSILFAAWVVQQRQGLWLPAALWAMHILLIGSAFGYSNLLFAVLFILLCSTASWVSGVLTLRKAWRVVGALDLVLSWIIAGIVIVQGASVEILLAILIASAALLGLVTYLTQTHEGEMANE
tara:strand:+ start:4914 stop:8825 length:3912 start_codon:yes stop_codon:yes gene_type:complete